MVGGVSSAHLIQPTPNSKHGGKNEVTLVSVTPPPPQYKMILRLLYGSALLLPPWKERVCMMRTEPFKMQEKLNFSGHLVEATATD